MKKALIFIIAGTVIVLSIWCLSSQSRSGQLSTLILGKSAEPKPIKIVRGLEAPDIVITPQHELLRVEHKNADGQIPLEIVQTPEGPVTIQRTFKTDGTLVKEEAFRDGKPVPIPPLASGNSATVEVSGSVKNPTN